MGLSISTRESETQPATMRRRSQTMLRCGSCRAFTLVELVVVVLILGILAGVAAPMMLDNSRQASKNAFVRHLRVCYEAIERYRIEHQEFPADAASGQLPVELQPYLRAGDFSEETPIGGQWDYQTNTYGFIAAIGVHFPLGDGFPGLTMMSEIDRIIDDGEISTGRFQSKASGNRYYWVQR